MGKLNTYMLLFLNSKDYDEIITRVFVYNNLNLFLFTSNILSLLGFLGMNKKQFAFF